MLIALIGDGERFAHWAESVNIFFAHWAFYFSAGKRNKAVMGTAISRLLGAGVHRATPYLGRSWLCFGFVLSAQALALFGECYQAIMGAGGLL